MLSYLRSSYLFLPQESGVYLFFNKEGNVIYVGKAQNIRKRVASYFTKTDLGEKTTQLVAKIETIRVTPVRSEIEAFLLEANLIKKYKPPYNVRFTDGKAYPLIRITVKDPFPKVLMARRMEDKNSLYFGPYPNVGAMRTVLKMLRRIFPYQSTLNHPNRPCLYYHLGLCPCPTVFLDEKVKKSYKGNIRHIIQFLSGKTKKIIVELEKERSGLSKKELFEEASNVQRKIIAIKLVTSPVLNLVEYDSNPNLLSDTRQKELDSLLEELQKAHIPVSKLSRIECYDISNISGKFATGSLVVFTNGEKDASQYRHFKIRTVQGPNDVLMMEHVLLRRFTHDEWPQPDLIIVDGGKTQVLAVAKALAKSEKQIPYVGLAKREEIIVTPDLLMIRLARDAKALHLLMRIRDEAHRFAIMYHKKLRSKFLLGG